MTRRNHEFEMAVTYKGHELRVTGTVTPEVPETGPTYDCGGTPAEPACIEDMEIVLVHRRKDGTIRKRELGELPSKLYNDVEALIFEALYEQEERDRDNYL